MAITIVARPTGDTQPVYNPIFYALDSTNKALPGFRYVFQIFDSTTSGLIAEYKVAPRPVDGFGFLDISKLLQSYISSALDLNETAFINADDFAEFGYDISFGEEFITTLPFDNVTLSPLPAPDDDLVFISFAPTANQFPTGAQVNIILPTEYGNCRDSFGGITSVRVGGFTSVLLNIVNQCGVATVVTGSFITFADNRKTRNVGLTGITGQHGYNAAISVVDWPSWTEAADFLATGPTIPLQTNLPTTGYSIQPWQDLWLNVGNGATGNATCWIFQGQTGPVWFTPSDNNAAWIKQFYAAPGMTATSYELNGSGPGVWNPGSHYQVWSASVCPCEEVTLEYNIGIGPLTQVVLQSAGQFNGRSYWTWVDGLFTFFLWYDEPNDRWEVSNALGGGNDFLQSILPDNGLCPPPGTRSAIPGPLSWDDGSNPLFTGFRLFPFTMTNTEAARTSLKYKIGFDTRCPINQTQLIFLDRLGSFGSFAFTLRQTKTNSVTRETYNREVGDISGIGGSWTYQLSEAGDTTWSSELTETFELNTDYMSDEMSVYFSDLMSSPEVYVQFSPSEPIQRCQVVTNSWTTFRSKNKKLIRYTVQIQTALTNPINV